MAKNGRGRPPKPSNKRKNTSKKATKQSNNNKSAAKPDAEIYNCKWGKLLEGGCVDLKYSADLKCCEFCLACNNMMHIDCYLTALKITTNARPRKINDDQLRCPKHCPHYIEHLEQMKKKNSPEKDERKRPPEKRPSEEDEMGMKQPAKHAQASAYRNRTDSSSEEDDRKQPTKESGEIDLSEDDTTSDEDDGGGKQRSRKSDTWNCHDGDLMPYDGGHSSSEEVSCSSMDYSSDDNSDDDHDDDDDGNNNGQGASKATTTTTKKKAAGAGNETAAEERTVATATTETAAAAAGSTASTSLSTIEDAAIAFAQRGFTLDGSELKKGDKLNKVGGVVCRLLREHPDPDGENQMDPSDISQMFDGWVNPAWWEIAFETWQVLYEMLDKKKEKIKSGTKVGGVFSEHACKLGRIFHTEQCEDATCDLCDRSLPPRLSSQEIVCVVCVCVYVLSSPI